MLFLWLCWDDAWVSCIKSDRVAGALTDFCYHVAKYLCEKLNLDFDKLKPNVVIEKD